ncbi:WD repeat and coiled-coil-containing protein-like [Saccostrea echinata]|uniref:WD repeat and coiled-coil-containing protein-like n=1 Tax=Saccostrea echinata TaxID=191078 RepID=UPI002A81A7CF|nr:WD repeat and coiled-coil-containing protein-like [Saccostrea echinata]
MDLGHVNVRGQNVDLLHQAIHPEYGVVWTDGKTIYLAPVQLSHGQVVNQRAIKLGKFEQSVKSVHWSCNIGPHSCYMCVVHTQHLSLWTVDGVVPKLSFKQVRKLNVQPISKGCLWNPCRDILCILSKQQCSFFFSHAKNRGSYAFPPLESGKISCGSWSQDGTRLILCVGAVILVYTWDDIDLSINSFTPSAWKIPGLDGSIRSVSLLSKSLLVCATELPLESLCKNQDMFDAPTVLNGDNLPQSNDSDIIVPKKQTSSQSITGVLLNLPKNPQSIIQETAQLVTVYLRENRDPQRKSCVGVKGLLSPEVLIYEPSLRSLVVGSNTQNVLQVFTFTKEGPSGDLVKSAEIQMDKLERSKGISLIPKDSAIGYKGILIATGTKKNNDSTFLPSTSGSNMDVKLKFFSIDVDPLCIQPDKNLNESADSSESVCSSLSSIESPRQQIRVKMELEQTESSDNLNENTVPKCDSEDTTTSADLYLPKQKTRTELCDPSDTDSEASPREVTPRSDQNDNSNIDIPNQFDTDSKLSSESQETREESIPKITITDVIVADTDVSPREITLLSAPDNSARSKIVDLNQSISVESDLETEKVDFSEQEARFCSSISVEDTEDGMDEVTKSLNSRLTKGSEEQEGSIIPDSDVMRVDSIGATQQPLEEVPPSNSDGKQIYVQNKDGMDEVTKDLNSRQINTANGDEEGSIIPDSDVMRVDSMGDRATQQLLKRAPVSESEGEQIYIQDEDEVLKIEQMEQELLEQSKQIQQLSEKVAKIAQRVDETTLVFPTRYQSIENPDTVLIVCRCPNKKTARKTFLLDNGRLALDTVKTSFNLDTVEIFIDGDPCTVSSNIDGYIPLRFQPSSTLIIQGKPSNPRIPHLVDSGEHKHYDAETTNGTMC